MTDGVDADETERLRTELIKAQWEIEALRRDLHLATRTLIAVIKDGEKAGHHVHVQHALVLNQLRAWK